MQSSPYSCTILMRLESFDRFSKNTQISNLTNIRPVGSGLFYAGERRDMAKISVAFRDFAKRLTNYNYLKGILATSLQTLPFF